MQQHVHSIKDSTSARGPVSVPARHADLHQEYRQSPDKAWIVDSARTRSTIIPATEPLYTDVNIESLDSVALPIAVHRAVGGESDLPTPGHLLAAAIASCFDSATRMIANRLGLEIIELEVSADLGIDVRGTLCMDMTVPVGFQTAELKVHIVGGKNSSESQIQQVLKAAEHCCVLMQTLNNPPPIAITTNITKQ
jgi:uncharacterized OsmC-like protein